MRLRVDERERLLKVTHPSAIRASTALDWAASHKDWVAEQLGKMLPAEPFVPGSVIPFDGIEVELCWSGDLPRVPRLVDGLLGCGGPAVSFPRRIAEFLKGQALETLSRETAEVASRCGLRASAVSVGDPRTRWGSCSEGGRIRYSWRLILAYPDARRFVVAHEVAHLRHLDHGPAFKALERELFGGATADARALLRASAPRLRRIGLAS